MVESEALARVLAQLEAADVPIGPHVSSTAVDEKQAHLPPIVELKSEMPLTRVPHTEIAAANPVREAELRAENAGKPEADELTEAELRRDALLETILTDQEREMWLMHKEGLSAEKLAAYYGQTAAEIRNLFRRIEAILARTDFEKPLYPVIKIGERVTCDEETGTAYTTIYEIARVLGMLMSDVRYILDNRNDLGVKELQKKRGLVGTHVHILYPFDQTAKLLRGRMSFIEARRKKMLLEDKRLRLPRPDESDDIAEGTVNSSTPIDRPDFSPMPSALTDSQQAA